MILAIYFLLFKLMFKKIKGPSFSNQNHFGVTSIQDELNLLGGPVPALTFSIPYYQLTLVNDS